MGIPYSRQVDDAKNIRVLEGLCLLVMRLIYISRPGMYFLNLLLFTQPSAVSVTAAI